MSGPRTRGGRALRTPFTAIPDATLEALARAPVLTQRRLRVALVLCRWSFGFHRDWVFVSPQGLGAATGLEAKKAIAALRELVRARVVLERPFDEHPAYAINAASVEWLDEVPAPAPPGPDPQVELGLEAGQNRIGPDVSGPVRIDPGPVDKSGDEGGQLGPIRAELALEGANLARNRSKDLDREIS